MTLHIPALFTPAVRHTGFAFSCFWPQLSIKPWSPSPCPIIHWTFNSQCC